uniref:hypothetical protein n=1 Tax=Agathobacter sp. TaxID=2021311 RepID=UPI0040566B2F
MQIILSILQFIGIVLLVLLGILLFLILAILFHPICYTIKGELYTHKTVNAKVSWLFHLIRAKASYEDGLLSAKISILWKTIPFSHEFSSKGMDDASKMEEENAEADEWPERIDSNFAGGNMEKNSVENTPNASSVITKTEADYEADTICKKQNSAAAFDASENNAAYDSSESTATDDYFESDEQETENEPKKGKISLIEKIKGMISKIKGTINKIKQVWNEIKAIIKDERNQSAVRHIKNEILSLLKSFLPVKSKINGVFSTGSPDTTGQVFGVIAVLPFMYQNEWSLTPDFTAESAYFEGSFYAKGRIYLYKIVGMLLRILLDKNCRRLYTVIRGFIKNLNR